MPFQMYPKASIKMLSPPVLPSSPLIGPRPALTVYILSIASSASPNDSLAAEMDFDVPSGFASEG
jgi:hypothetical protein